MALLIYDRIFSGHWLLLGYHGRGFVHDFPRLGGGSYITKVIAVMDKGVCTYFFDDQEFNKSANFAANRLLNDNKWRTKIYDKINLYADKFFKSAKLFRNLPLDKLSRSSLAKEFMKVSNLQHLYQVSGVIVNGLIIDGKNHLSNKIMEELRGFSSAKDFNKHWTLLSQVTKLSLHQKKDYKLALLASRRKALSKNRLTLILKKLYRNYCWLDYLYLGPVILFEEFKKEFGTVCRGNVNLSLPLQLNKIKKQQQELMAKLNYTNRARFLVQLAQTVIWQKGLRKDLLTHSFYSYEALWRLLAKQQGVNDWKIFTFLLPWEVPGFILEKKLDISALERRRHFSCFLVNKQGNQMMIDSQAKKYVSSLIIQQEQSLSKETRGQCAYTGKVKGVVKIIQIPKDMIKMNRGNILLSQATSPDLLPAMRKAAAIVTNKGGLICHAAITARELKIPCIVGTNNATLLFKDGDLVEVDANKGIVKKIK
ncbi:MAG: PEP-utilizing enzyme [Patescibacteria group bacterium]